MRADAARNRDHLLDIAQTVVGQQGADASLRDIARTAGVGLATLFRHFPTREALLEAILRESFNTLTARAAELETSSAAGDAVVAWMRDFLACAHEYRGVVTAMMTAIDDPESALHSSCVSMRAAGTRLLTRAQTEGVARPDIDGTELFALAGSLAWLGDQPSLAPRIDHLLDVLLSAVLPGLEASQPSRDR